VTMLGCSFGKGGYVSNQDVVTVVLGRFDSLLAGGLAYIFCADSRFRVLDRDLEADELERVVVQRQPDVAILGGDVAYTLLKRLRARRSTTGLIFLVDRPDYLCGTMLLAAGASCLALGISNDDLLTAAYGVGRGSSPLFRADGEYYPVTDTQSLTPRQTEVLKLLKAGRTNPQIAEALSISVETARTHVGRVLRKCGVRSRWDLIGT
jgi:DNA-binding NarL/FixJ family response regulator